MRSLATICMVLLAALSITIAKVQAFDSATDSEAEESEVFQQEALGGSLNPGVSPDPTKKTPDEITPTESQIEPAAQDPVWVLDDIYVADTSIACGPSDLPKELPPNSTAAVLKRRCKYEDTEQGLSVDMFLWLTCEFPRVLTYANPGKFEADADLEFNLRNDNKDTYASLKLQLDEPFDPSPTCEKEEYDEKKIPRGVQVSETLELSASCDYVGECTPDCDYYDRWWSGEEAMFGFKVKGSVGEFSPSFYIWLTYKESYGVTFLLSINKSQWSTGTGTVKSSPTGIDCGEDCTQRYPPDTLVTLTATPDSGSFFATWDWQGHPICRDRKKDCVFILGSDFEINPMFARPKLSVYLQGNGKGSVTSDPAGINCSEPSLLAEGCRALYNVDQVVKLTAHPGALSTFEGWEVEGTNSYFIRDEGYELHIKMEEKERVAVNAKFKKDDVVGPARNLLLLE